MSGFAMVPGWLTEKKINNKKLSGNGLLAYVNLALRGTWNPGTGEYDECRPSMKTLANDMGVAVNTARNAVQEVERFGGVLGTERFDETGNQLPTVYRVIFGKVIEPPSPPPPPKNDRGVPQKTTGGPLQKTTDNQEPIHPEPNTKTKTTSAKLESVPAAADPVEPSGELALAVPSQRPDVDQLCQHLAERIVANGCKPPKITKAWKDSARLLLDKDGRDFDKTLRLIDWCQDSEFWRANVMSMSKFRERYDQLRLQALAEWEREHRPAPNRSGLVEAHGMMLTQKNAAMFDLIAELKAEEEQKALSALPSAPVTGWMRELEGAR